MASKGEECLYQKPIHNYFDSGYDLIFDAAIEHNCMHFRKVVVPAQACGTCCSAFQPLRGTSSPVKATPSVDDASAHDVRLRSFFRRRLEEVCHELDDNLKYLERQIPTREQRWRETDVWLSRQDTKLDVLGYELAKAKRDLSVSLSELQRIHRQLDSIKARLTDSQSLELLWQEQKKLEHEAERARQAQQRAQDLLIEREKREAEQAQLYARWEDALERVPLLKLLRSAIVRRVETWLADSHRHISDSDAERIKRFLQQVPTYFIDDVQISKLRKVVQQLSHEYAAT